ncbi:MULTISPECIES: phage gp6-like head-tail connector protein [Klebsiella pneumoniae complex]|uniref:phage gp6-like head-tail connector protein n=1 Tax=Klebsiella pneumoniae complex TaxID=3390273 RepID=UPI00190E916F|nr:phage gp6-like head-tail connector protein [Klebsiella variicola]MCQ4061347.1 phage gp6-like head-tail connector protein [Klebsiella pneumoniae]HBS6975516.1 phage gp6-like head-tail connector protein [Klebsiella pneumoniae]
MNERELSLIRALGEEFSQALSELRESFRKSLGDHLKATEEKLAALTKEVSTLKETTALNITAQLADAVASIPAPKIPELPDIGAMVSEAVATLPLPQDGKSVTPEDLRPLLQELVTAAVGEIPVPRDGKDYDPAVLKQAVDDAVAALPPAQDGRDALQLEIQPFIDEGKSYPRGSYATHNGGLWRAYEKTHGMRGWECIVDGVSDVDISMNGQRNFIVTVNRASGASEKKSFDIPAMVYRGVFKSGDEYLPGDTVTWGGSLWHCDEQTQDKPGEAGSKGWTLAAKRGRDGRDKT